MLRSTGAALIVLALAASAPARAAGEGRVDQDDFPECFDAVPRAAAIPLGNRLDLHVLVLLDGVPLDRGRDVLARADAPYAQVGLRLVPQFRQVAFQGVDDRGLMEQAKELLGGRRPATAHLVFVLTSKDISAQTLEGEDPGIAGTADCIGGIAFPDRAFAVGEDLSDPDIDRTPKVATHELGHLLGAHHHYANCVEGLAAGSSTLSPCTIMMSAAPRFLTLRFSAVSATVVRGYAEQFALPVVPTPPPPPPSQERQAQLPVTVKKRVEPARRVNTRRSFVVGLRSSERVRDLRASLERGTGSRTVFARGALSSLDGTASLRMRIRRKVRAGRYRLRLTGSTTSTGRATAEASVRFSA